MAAEMTTPTARPMTPIQSDGGVPIIIEHPDQFPWGPGEREQWREATDEEYEQYRQFWKDVVD